MTNLALRESQQSRPPAAGAWKLEAGRALTLHPAEPGELRVHEGRLWATLDGPHSGSMRGLGDLVIEGGGTLQLRAGQRVVIEPAGIAEAVYFSWTVAEQSPRVPCWEPVAQSWRELQAGLALTGGAAARLATGLAAVGLASLPRRTPGSRIAA
ncbi:DUF2917 domain-containing protein [Ramlibacter sp. MMS24-I3-19]|uniref:DUF2917 domain-containing protein n=1 Tax=Ramlibacter sp. MMS24-I3-19 TaxID=3416606 RepID=UPI003CFC0B6B